MPNPFNKDEAPVEKSTGAVVPEAEITGSLFCESCFQESTTGYYSKESRRLRWTCRHCGLENVVRNIDINV